VAFGVLTRFDVDALCRTRGRAAEARDAAWRAVLAMGEPEHASDALGLGRGLLGVRGGVDPVADAVENGIVPLAEHHFLRVPEKVPHRDAEAADGFRHVALNTRASFGTCDGLSYDFARSERLSVVGHRSVHAPM